MTDSRPVLRLPPPEIGRWRRARCDRVASCRVFDVCRIELSDAAGRPRGDGFTLRCADWCNVVAVTPDNEVVLVWQYRFGTDALSLEIPGGVIDAGESPEEAARRELREETGYEASQFEPLLTLEPNPALQNNRCFTFLALGAQRTGQTGFDDQEELEMALVPSTHIGALLDGGQVTHALVQSALEAFWRKHMVWRHVESLVEEIEALERDNVLELARRLRPGLTLDDIANPHDFPELTDPDWQQREGVLSGVRGVLAAVRARRRDEEAAARSSRKDGR